MTITRTLWTAALAALLVAGAALAETPAAKCASDKNKEAGKYVECRHKGEAKFALMGDFSAYFLSRSKCADRYGEKWPAIESKAGGTCPSTGDQTAIRQYLENATTNVAAALAGGTLAGRGQRLKTGQIHCWNAAGQGISCPGSGQDGEFQKGLDRAYVDHGDGTITDTRTGLMWEKLSDDGSIHDKDNYYFRPNHLAKAVGLNQQGFAGYTDWRVPNVKELQSLVNYGTRSPAISPEFHTGCVPGCTVLTCSCTNTSYYGYWTSSAYESNPTRSWIVEFLRGEVRMGSSLNAPARAVRGGS
jgi:hypothetical protein